MEIILAAFVGVWLTFFSVWSYIRLKKEYRDILAEDKKEKNK